MKVVCFIQAILTTVNRLNEAQIPAAQTIKEWICLCSSCVNSGSLHCIPQLSTPSKIASALSVGTKGFRHLPEILYFNSLISFLHTVGNNSVFSHLTKLGHIVWLKTILQGPETILHISWEGKSTVSLIHFGINIEHSRGWTTAQHFGICLSACNMCSLSCKII